MRWDKDELASGLSAPYRFMTSLLLFGLLAEWLLPWTGEGEWTILYHPVPLLTIIGCMLATGLFKMNGWMTAVIHTMLVIVCLMWLYKSESQSSIDWLLSFPGMLAEQVMLIAEGGLWAMSGELRTLLLFAGWAMLAPALQALIWLRQAALGIAALTLLYLVTLHVWLGMDVMGGLLRTSAEGLLLAAIVSLPRARRLMDAGIGKLKEIEGSWLAGSLFITLIVVGCALLAAGDKDNAATPAGWTASITDRLEQSFAALNGSGSSVTTLRSVDSSGLGRALTGYGFDDTSLGGAVSDNPVTVFWGYSPLRTYWRGEAKAEYDGRGWSNPEHDQFVLMPVRSITEEADRNEPGEDSAAAASQDEVLSLERPLITQTVIWDHPAAAMPIFLSGKNGKVSELIAADPRRKLGSYLSNGGLGSLYAQSGDLLLEEYTVQSQLPVTDAATLRALGSGDKLPQGVQGAEKEWSKEELAQFLQLPATLPVRVRALAAEVAGGGVTSRYDRVKAVEQYLENTYRYSKTDSAVPPAGADFVDHFLFEQKSGYCVHFSTAMVVLLRAEGIPARWVKGFAPGTPVRGEGSGGSSLEAGTLLYEVKSSDAHAWVEVYFPGAGWVPFDPTPGYDGVSSIAAAASGAPGGMLGASAGAGGSSAAVGAAAGGGLTLAERLEAAAEDGAAAISRGARELAGAAKRAAGFAAAEPGAAAAIGAAALALAGAAVAAAQRRRLRVALALRRYRAASLERAALQPQAATGAAGEPLGPRRPQAAAAAASAAERQRGALIAAAEALIALLLSQLRRDSKGALASREGLAAIPDIITTRELTRMLGERLPENKRATLALLAQWLEEASFGAPDGLENPPAYEELRDACRMLASRRVPRIGKKSAAPSMRGEASKQI